ncbi:transketolase [Candidatus Woesebacteria bacterium]|nr:transketolase [Candidatus Woesebacteria bacterium]
MRHRVIIRSDYFSNNLISTIVKKIKDLARLLRYYSLVTTTEAGSGHPTSCLSAADLMAVLMFNKHFRYDTDNPNNPLNDRLIFSKGHAAPLFYALWAVAGAFPKDELMTLRKFGSRVEGHPTMRFPYTEVPTGSLGMGLSVGLGMALNAKYEKLPYRTYVLLGDSEMAEGSVWEALQIGAHYKLDNVVGIIDVNRLGQRGETMYGHDLAQYEDKVRSFGWFPLLIDGHDLEEIDAAYTTAAKIKDRPTMIIAKTLKGKGVSFLEDAEGKHGVALKPDELEKALLELGPVDTTLTMILPKPKEAQNEHTNVALSSSEKSVIYKTGELVATRQAYGHAVSALAHTNPSTVSLDAETSNSTYADEVKKQTPRQFFEMFIAEQNMIGMAIGLAKRDKVPFVSTFSAFLTRAFDQLRMAAYANANIKVVGSHAGVSIGVDGSSQMGLEDIALMRSLFGSVVLYPSDAVATAKLVAEMTHHVGVAYLRTTREKTPVLYGPNETFSIGGSKVHLVNNKPHTHVIIAAGITLHEALKAQKKLADQKIITAVVDVYSIKPLDAQTLLSLTKDKQPVVVVEDHYPEGGIAEAVRSAIENTGVKIISLAVRKMPMSGKPEELLKYEHIDAEAIVESVASL